MGYYAIVLNTVLCCRETSDTREKRMMPRGNYEPPAGYLTLQQVAERLGWNQPKLRRRVLAGVIRTVSDPNDARVKLVRAEDIEALIRSMPGGEA